MHRLQDSRQVPAEPEERQHAPAKGSTPNQASNLQPLKPAKAHTQHAAQAAVPLLLPDHVERFGHLHTQISAALHQVAAVALQHSHTALALFPSPHEQEEGSRNRSECCSNADGNPDPGASTQPASCTRMVGMIFA
jgi:hypothetical protein